MTPTEKWTACYSVIRPRGEVGDSRREEERKQSKGRMIKTEKRTLELVLMQILS